MPNPCDPPNLYSLVVNGPNIVTNAAYLLAGIAVLKSAQAWLGKITGWSFIVLAIGSTWFHSTRNATANTFDIVGVYLALLSLITYAATQLIDSQGHHLAHRKSWNAITTVAILALACVMGRFRAEVDLFDSTMVGLGSSAILLLLILFSWRLTHVSSSQAGWQAAAILSFGVAALFKFSDGTEPLWFNWCQPNSVFQPHAMWHLFSALGLWALYAAFRHIGPSRFVAPAIP